MTTLNDINFGINQFCGPSVLSALTGKSTDECASVISSISGKQTIEAVNISHLLQALQKLRFDNEQIQTVGRSLYANLIGLSSKDGIYIVLIPKHVVAVEVSSGLIYLIDNHSKSALPANSSARLMQTVTGIYKLSKRANPILLRTDISIIKEYNNIRIKATEIYEDFRDNVEMNRGYIYYRNIEELEQIINELAKIGEV